MKIIITKGKSRTTLTCKRQDSSYTSVNLGPNLPNHDIAHYVVEKAFQLPNGFYGQVKAGMALEDLSDPAIIRTLAPEVWLSEIMARNLQALGTGAANAEQFIELVNWEAQTMDNIQVPMMSLAMVETIKNDFEALCQRWQLIPENGSLHLDFN